MGRDRELELLRSYVDQVLGHGGVLVLSGEPGVGKSVLLDGAATAATAAGALVLRSDGVEFLADQSFAGLHHVLEPLLHGCDGLDPAHHEALTVALGAGDGAPVDRLVLYKQQGTARGRALPEQRCDLPELPCTPHQLRRASGVRCGSPGQPSEARAE